ncbi:MAG TPA: haloacid dehalogenase-like hydrolase [Streptosporangiaceae bacterium]|nr:haloacid dehalogenase-like hydrolase [Streptosporangiaceae bacterium]
MPWYGRWVADGGVLVLWDVDYTLIDSAGLGEDLYRIVFRELFGGELPGMVPMAGRTDRAIVADTLARAGIRDPAAHLEPFLALMAARAPELPGPARERVRVLPGVPAALAALGSGQRRVVQSVLTGNVPALARVKLGAAGLTSYLDLNAGAYGDHHEVRAELVHQARRNAARVHGTGFGGAATVLIGDTPLDVAAARATGARSVAVATGRSAAAELAAAGADAVLPDLTDTAAVLSAVLDSR